MPTSRFMLLKSPSTGAGLLMSLTGAMFACLFSFVFFSVRGVLWCRTPRGQTTNVNDGARCWWKRRWKRGNEAARDALCFCFFCVVPLFALSLHKREKHAPLHVKSWVKARVLCCVVFCMSFCGYEPRDSRTFKIQVWPPLFHMRSRFPRVRHDTPRRESKKETKGGLRKGAQRAPSTHRPEPRKNPVARSLKLSSHHRLFMPFPKNEKLTVN